MDGFASRESKKKKLHAKLCNESVQVFLRPFGMEKPCTRAMGILSLFDEKILFFYQREVFFEYNPAFDR